ncbi:MAG TPA: hypothetical protein VI457_12965 [Methylococcaceae bacterium]|nr:hypothetical protein [Methylococcaceae bacterium]
MNLDHAFFDTWTPRALALLRIVTAFLFLQRGTAKLLLVPHLEMFDDLSVFSLTGFAGVLEIVVCFIFLLLAFAGAGAWSIDAARGRTANS